MKKIIITGGSGFIGTNLVEYYSTMSDIEVLNLDKLPPRDSRHNSYWKKVDLLDPVELTRNILEFDPTYVLHMAARTDLKETKNIDGYASNTQGVENLISVLKQCRNLKRVIFASSMLVCKVGVNPKTYDEYFPSTLYGESKVKTEKIVKQANIDGFEWVIIRPTSIWGPWFGEPYRNFFDTILNGRYFKMTGKVSVKNFGFVGNSIYQINSLLNADKDFVNERTFYIGDSPAYNINEWANEIAFNSGIRLRTIPSSLLKFAGYLGDFLKLIDINFPMTSFRYKNMITDNIISLLDDTYKIANELPYSRQQGIELTLEWVKKN